jgi:hypothetical protein
MRDAALFANAFEWLREFAYQPGAPSQARVALHAWHQAAMERVKRRPTATEMTTMQYHRTHRTFGKTSNCAGCRYWSELIAMGKAGEVHALCLSPDGPVRGEYTAATQTCKAWASGHLGPIDEPGNDSATKYLKDEASALVKVELWPDQPDGPEYIKREGPRLQLGDKVRLMDRGTVCTLTRCGAEQDCVGRAFRVWGGQVSPPHSGWVSIIEIDTPAH